MLLTAKLLLTNNIKRQIGFEVDSTVSLKFIHSDITSVKFLL